MYVKCNFTFLTVALFHYCMLYYSIKLSLKKERKNCNSIQNDDLVFLYHLIDNAWSLYNLISIKSAHLLCIWMLNYDHKWEKYNLLSSNVKKFFNKNVYFQKKSIHVALKNILSFSKRIACFNCTDVHNYTMIKTLWVMPCFSIRHFYKETLN